MSKVFHAYVAGYERTFASLDDLRTWVNGLRTRTDLAGKVLKIDQGYRECGWNVYPPDRPRREITIGAAQ